ncbi:MAG: hypothetical protein HY092_03860 [Candidatus Kerfeldbacteria bacterium]|nr:hypothetical protein [Candidatus Kerfeldbacteria bacterium]
MKIKFLELLALLMLLSAGHVLAATVGPADNAWNSAVTVKDPAVSNDFLGTLETAGDVRFFHFALRQEQTIKFVLDVPGRVDQRFSPRLVIFEPESQTASPLLPFPTPPGTIAMIYPADNQEGIFDPMTLVHATRRLSTNIALTPGDYYIAVYNAAAQPGQFRLWFGSPSLHPDPLARTPLDWWTVEWWAGWSPLIIWPLGLIVLAIFGWWLYRQPSSRPAKKRKP